MVLTEANHTKIRTNITSKRTWEGDKAMGDREFEGKVPWR